MLTNCLIISFLDLLEKINRQDVVRGGDHRDDHHGGAHGDDGSIVRSSVSKIVHGGPIGVPLVWHHDRVGVVAVCVPILQPI